MALADGLAAAYDADEASGNLIDAAGGSLDLTESGTIAAITGHISGARACQSGEYFSRSAAFRFTGSWTIAAWIRMQSGANFQRVIGNWGGGGDSGYILSYHIGGFALQYAGNATGEIGAATETWHLVIISFNADDEEIRLRLNNTGSPVVVTANSGVTPTGDFSINWFGQAEADYDSIFIWDDRQLSSAEEEELWNGGDGLSSADILGGGGQTVAVGLVTETDSAFSVTGLKAKQLGLLTETDTAFAVSESKTKEVGLVTDVETALPVSPLKSQTLGLITESDSALDVASSKSLGVGLVSETDSALGVGGGSAVLVGLTNESDSSLALAAIKTLVVGLVSESGLAQPILSRKLLAVGLIGETDSAFPVVSVKRVTVGMVLETELALPLGWILKTRLVGLVTETDSALPFPAAGVPKSPGGGQIVFVGLGGLFELLSGSLLADSELADDKAFAYAAYPLDESSGTRTDLIGNNPLLPAGVVGVAAGKFQLAADFSNGSLGGTEVPWTDSILFRVWVKPRSVTDGLVLGIGSPLSQNSIRLRWTGSSFELAIRSTMEAASLISFGQSAGNWYLVHAWLVRATGEFCLVINAGIPGVHSVTTAPVTTGIPLKLGGDEAAGVVTNPFDGLIDDAVVLVDRVLDDPARVADYNLGAGIPYTDWAGRKTSLKGLLWLPD